MAERAVVRDRWSLVVAAGLLAFVAMLDMNVVTVALPTVRADLDASVTGVQWLVTGYQVPLTALLLPVGRWLDAVDRRPALTGSVLAFVGTSAAVAVAPSLGWVVAARVGQGVAAAAVFALMPVLAAEAVRPEARGRAMAVLATLGPLGAVTGPAAGGMLVEAVGWRPVFLLGVPAGLAVLAIGRRGLPPGRRPVRPGAERVAEAVALGGAVAAVVLAVTLAPGDLRALALVPVAVPPVLLWRRLPAAAPVLALRRVPGLPGVHAAVLALAAAFAGTFFLLPFHLQRAGADPTTTGLVVLAVPLGMLLAGPAGGALADRWTAAGTAAAGAAIVTAGLLLVLPLSAAWSPAELALRLAVVGAGLGLYGGPAQALALAAAPAGATVTVAATVQVARSLGFTLGPAVAAAVWAASGQTAAGLRAGVAVAAAAALGAAGALARIHSSRLRHGTGDGRCAG